MKKSTARVVANVVLVSAAAAVAYVIVTTPPLRRLVWAMSRRWLAAGALVPLLTAAPSPPAEAEPGA